MAGKITKMAVNVVMGPIPPCRGLPLRMQYSFAVVLPLAPTNKRIDSAWLSGALSNFNIEPQLSQMQSIQPTLTLGSAGLPEPCPWGHAEQSCTRGQGHHTGTGTPHGDGDTTRVPHNTNTPGGTRPGHRSAPSAPNHAHVLRDGVTASRCAPDRPGEEGNYFAGRNKGC